MGGGDEEYPLQLCGRLSKTEEMDVSRKSNQEPLGCPSFTASDLARRECKNSQQRLDDAKKASDIVSSCSKCNGKESRLDPKQSWNSRKRRFRAWSQAR